MLAGWALRTRVLGRTEMGRGKKSWGGLKDCIISSCSLGKLLPNLQNPSCNAPSSGKHFLIPQFPRFFPTFCATAWVGFLSASTDWMRLGSVCLDLPFRPWHEVPPRQLGVQVNIAGRKVWVEPPSAPPTQVIPLSLTFPRGGLPAPAPLRAS